MSVTQYGWGNANLPKNAVQHLVPADGTIAAANTITYAQAFANGTSVVNLSVGANYTGSDNAAISVRLNAVPTATGFQIIADGGQPGTTVDIHWEAYGT